MMIDRLEPFYELISISLQIEFELFKRGCQLEILRFTKRLRIPTKEDEEANNPI